MVLVSGLLSILDFSFFLFELTTLGSRFKLFLFTDHRPHGTKDVPVLPRTESTSEFTPVDDKEVEYFFASDASAVIEHTNRVIYLEVGNFL